MKIFINVVINITYGNMRIFKVKVFIIKFLRAIDKNLKSLYQKYLK